MDSRCGSAPADADHGGACGTNASIPRRAADSGTFANMSTHPKTTRKSKQQRLAEAIVRTGALAPLRSLHDRGRVPALILAYHRIVATAADAPYPLDRGLISATPEEFEMQLLALREFSNPVSLDQVADAVTHGRTLPERAVAVTFDDGFSDTFEIAFPLLRRHEIPATVFVSTGHVESLEPFWFELTAHLMLRIPPRSIVMDGCAGGLPSGDDEAARRDSIATVHRLLKACDNTRRGELVEEWRRRFAACIDASVVELGRSITRPQIEQMARNGISFGSHTISHPNLFLASDDAITHELQGSKSALETLLHAPVRCLAYPFGVPGTYDARAMRIARECGYELALSYRQGVNWLGALQPYELRRIGIGPGISPAQFRAMIALPEWLHPKLDAHHH
jgi:peptidoglycan/xylan/chitin deacetylase (PgdA/CDA1 family)